MRNRVLKIVKPTAIVLAIGFTYLLLHELTGLSIPCPFHLVTGLYCPGCGISRMCLHLFRWELAEAFSANCLIFCLLPIGAVMLAVHLYRYIRYGDAKLRRFENIILCVMIGLLLVFGVVRNIWQIDLLIP